MTPKLLFLLESNVAGRSEGWRWGGCGCVGGVGGSVVTTTLSSNGLSIYPALAQQSSASAALSASIA